MNAEQQYEIIQKIVELKGSRACVAFRTGNDCITQLVIHVTGTGYQVSETHNCKRVESCIQIRDYNTAIKVLNKIIKQAKNN